MRAKQGSGAKVNESYDFFQRSIWNVIDEYRIYLIIKSSIFAEGFFYDQD
jgi:hypothetical protein